jgi:DNA-binding NtrC family response regulator
MARVLIVEDSDRTRSLYKRLLLRAGHDVFVASSPKEARSTAIIMRPDVVLSGLCLPGPQEGEDLIRFYQDTLPGVPVVVLAGSLSDSGDECAAADRFGVAAFLLERGGCFRVAGLVHDLAAEGAPV